MSAYKVAVIVGSNRKESINRKLAGAIAKLSPSSMVFTEIKIDDLPMYNADLETSRSAEVSRFTSEVAACDAVLIVMPEHNRSLPAVLKNAIDWGSKPMDKNVWRDKPTAITGTSPGAIGTAVGQQHARQIMGILGASVIGGEAYIQFKADLIDGHGDFTVDATRTFVQDFVNRFATFVGKLAAK
jgi:chromate reductase